RRPSPRARASRWRPPLECDAGHPPPERALAGDDRSGWLPPRYFAGDRAGARALPASSARRRGSRAAPPPLPRRPARGARAAIAGSLDRGASLADSAAPATRRGREKRSSRAARRRLLAGSRLFLLLLLLVLHRQLRLVGVVRPLLTLSHDEPS